MTATSPGNNVVYQVTSGDIYVPPSAVANMDWIIKNLPAGNAGPYAQFTSLQGGNVVGISCPSGWSPVNNFGGSKVVSSYDTPIESNESTNGSSVPPNTVVAIRMHSYAVGGGGSSYQVNLSSGNSGLEPGGASLKSTLHFVGGTPPNPFLHLICVSNSHGGPWSNTSI